MSQPTTGADRTVIAAVLAAVLGWIGVVGIGLGLAASSALGFDLELLLDAARDLAAGRNRQRTSAVIPKGMAHHNTAGRTVNGMNR